MVNILFNLLYQYMWYVYDNYVTDLLTWHLVNITNSAQEYR